MGAQQYNSTCVTFVFKFDRQVTSVHRIINSPGLPRCTVKFWNSKCVLSSHWSIFNKQQTSKNVQTCHFKTIQAAFCDSVFFSETACLFKPVSFSQNSAWRSWNPNHHHGKTLHHKKLLNLSYTSNKHPSSYYPSVKLMYYLMPRPNNNATQCDLMWRVFVVWPYWFTKLVFNWIHRLYFVGK